MSELSAGHGEGVGDLNERLAGALDEAPLGVSILDGSSVFVYVNDAMAELHGVARVDHVGRSVNEVLPGIAPAISQALEDALLRGEVTTDLPVEGPSPHDPSSNGHWRMSVAPWRRDDGTVAGVSVVARDVTTDVRTQALQARLQARQAAIVEQERGISRILQDAMLTRLPEPDHLQLQARYRPAAQDVAVGGDWYDAVLDANGATTVIIGDVAGHDTNAAAAMGQVRGVLRAYVWDRDEDPATTVSRLDRALPGLQLDVLATLVCGRIEQVEADRVRGLRHLRWTNAGHLPPLLHVPGVGVRVLHSEPDLLVGLDPQTPRTSHAVELPPGSTLLLYTDGLVERRGAVLDDGIARLQDARAWEAGKDLGELLDELLDELADGDAEDDIAVLGVRFNAEGSVGDRS